MGFKSIERKREWSRNYAREWRKKNLERAKKKEREASRKRQLENPEQVRAWRRDFYHRHKERLAFERKSYFEGRKVKKAAYDEAYRLKNKAKRDAQIKAWHVTNRERMNAYHRNQRRTNPQYALRNNLRCRMNTALRNYGLKRDYPLEKLLGCTVEFLMGYLEAQFKEGMSWQNRGDWHIDHIRACAKFDLTDVEQRARCFHYTNLQPLWRAENLAKGDR